MEHMVGGESAQTPDAIRQQIEHTRADLGRKFEALQSEVRVTVGQRINTARRFIERARELLGRSGFGMLLGVCVGFLAGVVSARRRVSGRIVFASPPQPRPAAAVLQKLQPELVRLLQRAARRAFPGPFGEIIQGLLGLLLPRSLGE
jgi:hypothetical protein